MDTTTFPREVLEEVWQNTFGTGGESFHWWRQVRFIEGDWDVIGRVELVIDDPNDEDGNGRVSKVVGIDEVLAAALAVTASSVDACTGKPIVLGAELDWDACVSDCVMQTAVLGEVVYG